jgi:nucleoid-associated protein YgaU
LEPSDKMTHAIRLVVPALVLVLGFAAACLFRRPVGVQPDPGFQAGRPATFTQSRRAAPENLRMEVPAAGNASEGGPGRSGSGDGPGSARTPDVALPNHPRALAEEQGPARSRTPGGVRRREPDTVEFVRRHRVVDGDSLRTLAGRYLGDANRADEIFQANRKRLSHPDAVPIGVELDIPPP